MMRSTSCDPGNYPQHGHGRDWYGRVDEPPAADHRWRAPKNGTALILMRKIGAEGGKIPQGPHPRSNNMTPHIPEEFSTRLIDWSPFVIMGNTMPPRDPDEDEADEDEEEEDRADELPVVREPDED